MVKGILADIHLSGPVSDLAREMQSEAWAELWHRNADTPDSLEATIRQHNRPDSLPVFTIGDLDKLRKSRAYAERVLERLYEYLIDIDAVRGTGRLFLP